MAECIRYVCTNCGLAVEAWSDGNPYYLDRRGKKHYAYHPDHERLARCVGNDTPHICLTCGERFMVDSRAPVTRCRKCEATDIARTFTLQDRKCPACKAGTFNADPDFQCIS